jgi:DNA-binding response OmpR family regulator
MHILIVEDDAIIAVSLMLVLESAGHTVAGACSSDEAVHTGVLEVFPRERLDGVPALSR